MSEQPTKRHAKTADGAASEQSPAGAPGLLLTWHDLLDQIARECAVAGTDAGVAVSVPRAFLQHNQLALHAKVDVSSICRLGKATAQAGGLSAAGYCLPSTGADDAAYVARVRRLVQAHAALTAKSFAAGFRQLFRDTGRFPALKQLASAAAVPVAKCRRAMGAHNGCTGLSEDEVWRLDKALGCRGKLIALYAALSQHAALKDFCPALQAVLKTETFGSVLRRKRIAQKLTLANVQQSLQAAGEPVSLSQLNVWEGGSSKPGKELAQAVGTLDALLSCGGALVSAYDYEHRRAALLPYALRFAAWPAKAQEQFKQLAAAKRLEYCAANQLDEGRWTVPASEDRALELVERVFGFLTHFLDFPQATLSLSLLADFPLLEAFFDFVRARVGRETYSTDAATTCRVLLNWYRWHFPRLLVDVSSEAYWRAKLPRHVVGETEIAPEIRRPFAAELATVEEQWRHQLFTATQLCTFFLQQKDKFASTTLGKSAEALFAQPGALAGIVEYIYEEYRALPGRVSCLDMALHLRRLTMAIVLIARCFRPKTLLSLRFAHVELRPDGLVWFAVPPELFKQKGKGGSALGYQGYLASPASAWMHRLFRRYFLEARPFLLFGAVPDEEYVFTSAHHAHQRRSSAVLGPGGPLDHEVLRRDMHHYLGYAPYAQRHVFATEAHACNDGPEEVANVLKNNARMVIEHYDQSTPEGRMAAANQTCEALLLAR